MAVGQGGKVMLNEKSINMIVSTPAFIKNANRLSYQLKMSRRDASQELLLELLDHRLRTWTDKDVKEAVIGDLPSLKSRIFYSQKDIVRRKFKDDKREQEKAEMLVNAEPSDNAQQTEQALALIPDLFKNSQTRDWVQSVLKVGKEQTMADFGQTERQFNNKLAKTCKYAVLNRERTRKIMNTKFDDNDMRELQTWQEFEQIIAFNPQNIQQFISVNRPLFDDLVNDSSIKQQGILLNDFEHALDSDKQSLIKLVEKRQAAIEHELTERTDD